MRGHSLLSPASASRQHSGCRCGAGSLPALDGRIRQLLSERVDMVRRAGRADECVKGWARAS